MADLDRFWSKVVKTEGCWNWIRGLDTAGYGLFSFQGKLWKAHRYCYMTLVGPIPKGIYVLHRCDNRICVNPAHLFLGTHVDNMADMKAKGRAYRPIGGKPGASVLTIDQVLQIRKLAVTGMPQRKIAKKFFITQANVGYIVRRKTWTHI